MEAGALLLRLLSGVAVAVVLLLSAAVLYLRHIHSKYAHIPGPKRASFFLGHLPNMKEEFEKGHFFADIMLRWMMEHGHTICLFVFHRPLVLTVDPEAVKEFLISGSHPKGAEGYHHISCVYGESRFLGRGLVTELDHNIWTKRRALLNPAFHRKLLKDLLTEFNQTTDDLMVKLRGLADGSTVVSLAEEMSRVSMDIIGKVAFGKNIDSLHDDQSPFPKAIHKAVEGFMRDSMYPYERYLPIRKKFKKEVKEAISLLRETGRKWVAEREQAMTRGEYFTNDILTYVIKSKDHDENMTLEECLDDFLTFFIAGQETTASLLSFIFLELGRRPELFHKLRDEVDSVLGEKPLVDFEDLWKLDYTAMLIKETLRLYPPGAVTFRSAGTDTTIENYHIPKGTAVVVNIYASGRMPDFHPDAFTFNPDRFQPESPDRPTVYTYYPFSLGPRSCIGQTFAQIEAKVIIAKFMQHFDMELDPDQSFDIIQELSLRPKDGAKARLRLRTKH